MVHHIILWKIKEEIKETEKQQILQNVKEGLEGLKGKIEGLKQIEVKINPLPSSNADLMLDSLFESETALKAYSVNPFHVEVADTAVRPFMEVRMCMDYED